jgi:ankyrin repeat protein
LYWIHIYLLYEITEEKLDEFLQQMSYNNSDTSSPGRRFSPLSLARQQDDTSFYNLIQELSNIIASKSGTGTGTDGVPVHTQTAMNSNTATSNVTREADRLMWEASSTLGDIRPPATLCIYDRSGSTTPPVTAATDDGNADNDMEDDNNTDNNVAEGEQITNNSNNNPATTMNRNNPPIFDGAVANATPPPLGGAAAGASGGSGTVLHLACALDRPLILAFLLIMGADGRASHTAFRRLMIHEAACNGSINCLRLLLEMGRKFAIEENEQRYGKETATTVPFLPDAMELSASSALGTSIPLFYARTPPPIGMNMRYFRRTAPSSSTGASPSSSFSSHGVSSNRRRNNTSNDGNSKHADFLSILRQFDNCRALVQKGGISEIQAARSLLANAPLLETTRTALIRSCAFQMDAHSNRSFLRPYGCADGHGNTPLHWAAFKNERECVALLLEYNADPNARAHPSGWTPLHDAAYSNSSECIELLINKGAHVDARANSGATPLCFAAQEDAADAARLLLDRGADLSARCAGANQSIRNQQQQQLPLQAPNNPHSRFSGYTPLHYCAHYNASKASRMLLDHSQAKIAMETPDLSGRLPIHVAVARGSSDVLRALLHAGARVDIRPTDTSAGDGRTPSSLPVMFGNFTAATQRRPPVPDAEPGTPNRSASVASSSSSTSSSSSSSSASPVTSPVLRSMIPSQPVSSSKPWNCLTQSAIDECKTLISKAEQSWRPEHHLLFTPRDRKAIMELLRVGKRLEQDGVIFVDLWPKVLGFCGRGWFDTDDDRKLLAGPDGVAGMQIDKGQKTDVGLEDNNNDNSSDDDDMDYLTLPSFQ